MPYSISSKHRTRNPAYGMTGHLFLICLYTIYSSVTEVRKTNPGLDMYRCMTVYFSQASKLCGLNKSVHVNTAKAS